jgi:RNA polymerase sigma-32 factor
MTKDEKKLESPDLTPEISRTTKAVAPYDPLQRYFLEIRDFGVLTREEEKALAIRYQEQGDLSAGERLIKAHLKLVVRIAMEFFRYWSRSLLDLIQEGNVGLVRALDKFDPYRGIKFSYYASFWIKAHLLKFIMENWKLVRIGTTQNQRKLFFNLVKERDNMIAEGLDPEPRLLAERLDVTEKEVTDMAERLAGSELSLNAPLKEDATADFSTVIPDEEQDVEERVTKKHDYRTLSRKIREFRKGLTGREADIFDHRIMAEEPETLQTLGERHHLSRERIRQLEERILANIKEYLEGEIPDFETTYRGAAG